MAVPVSQMYTVTKYVLTQKLRGVKRYPLVLMLEPLFRCNLACAGCGKIQYPDHVLDKRLTPAQCWAAADECAAPTQRGQDPGGGQESRRQLDAARGRPADDPPGGLVDRHGEAQADTGHRGGDPDHGSGAVA